MTRGEYEKLSDEMKAEADFFCKINRCGIDKISDLEKREDGSVFCRYNAKEDFDNVERNGVYRK